MRLPVDGATQERFLEGLDDIGIAASRRCHHGLRKDTTGVVAERDQGLIGVVRQKICAGGNQPPPMNVRRSNKRSFGRTRRFPHAYPQVRRRSVRLLSLVLGACTSDSSTTPGTSGPSGNGTNLATSARIERIRQQVLDGNYVFATSLKAVGDCNALRATSRPKPARWSNGLPSLYGEMFTAGRPPMQWPPLNRRSGPGQLRGQPERQGRHCPHRGSFYYSGTNNQESGVDEPDIVKSDGKRIVTITGNKLKRDRGSMRTAPPTVRCAR